MKKLLLSICLMMSAITWTLAQTAPDFTANDCSGTSHNLYTELAAGKVIVLVWVMPCSSCIGPSMTAYNVADSYSSTNPNTVLFYLMDDAGNTSCTTLNGWANNNSIGANRTLFSTSGIVESNYGGVGMPHVAVVGGANAHIYFNALNSAAGNSTGIQNAINSALAATGIQESNGSTFQLAAFANSQSVKVTYSMRESADVNLEIINETGQLVATKSLGKQPAGNYNAEFDLKDVANGIYFVRMNTENNMQSVKFVLAK